MPSDLDKEVRSELLSLTREVADTVARHLVAAGQIIDEDADLALAHATAARRLASRIAAVREAVGLAAYAAGDWATAIAELRTYHRMSGRQTHLAVIADCERALGRPERAIDLFRGADREALDKAGAIELLIVAAGARGDLGQFDAAVAMLQVRELTADEAEEWTARLRYAYADALLAASRRDEAREWFARAAAADEDSATDAAERLLELDGVTIEDDDEDDDEDEGNDDVRDSAIDDDDVRDSAIDEDAEADGLDTPAFAVGAADLDGTHGTAAGAEPVDAEPRVGATTETDINDPDGFDDLAHGSVAAGDIGGGGGLGGGGAVVDTEAEDAVVNDVDADNDAPSYGPDTTVADADDEPDADDLADELAAVEGGAPAGGDEAPVEGKADGDDVGGPEAPRAAPDRA